MGIITWIIIGAIAGALGKLIMPGNDPGGFIVTILLGIVGAFVGGFITQNILGMGSGGFIWTIIVATIGAIILLAIYRAIVGGRGGRTARR
ncbi:MAG: GlsB/YeaQ/YmgE family stress response membrane protein [Actinomycetota bacterium]|nr:GlsB/YeaQ/YmgE family stress response membrane protein [Actinomycetota bacterium]